MAAVVTLTTETWMLSISSCHVHLRKMYKLTYVVAVRLETDQLAHATMGMLVHWSLRMLYFRLSDILDLYLEGTLVCKKCTNLFKWCRVNRDRAYKSKRALWFS